MDSALDIVPDYSMTAEELSIMIVDQHMEWNGERRLRVAILAVNLGLATWEDIDSGRKTSSTEVRQRQREAEAFDEGIRKFPGLTKSEFLAGRKSDKLCRQRRWSRRMVKQRLRPQRIHRF